MAGLPNFHDSYLQRGEPLGMTVKTVNLTADDTVVDVSKISLLQISSDNTTATSRTFTLTSSVLVGHELTLEFVAGSSYTCELANSGNVQLTTGWTPTQYQTLKLVWDGTYWVEQTRSTTIGTASSVTTAMLSPVILVEATGSLTQANIIAMNGTAVSLVAAPGAGKLIVVDEAEFFHSYSTAAYTGGGDVQLQYHGSTVILDMDKTVVTATSSKSYWNRPTIYSLDNSTGTAAGGLDVTALANLAVEITNDTAVFAAGNAANVLKWRLRYRVITLLT